MARIVELEQMNESSLCGDRRKSGYLVSNLKKNIDFQLLVKSLGELLYFKWWVF